MLLVRVADVKLDPDTIVQIFWNQVTSTTKPPSMMVDVCMCTCSAVDALKKLLERYHRNFLQIEADGAALVGHGFRIESWERHETDFRLHWFKWIGDPYVSSWTINRSLFKLHQDTFAIRRDVTG